MTRFGLVDDPQHWDPPHLAEAKEIGCKVARISALWNEDPENKRDLVTRVRAAKMRPLFPLGGTEEPPIQMYIEACRRWASSYPSAMFEIWNEPNLPAFGALPVPAARNLMLLGNKAIKEVAKNAKVIGPAVSPAKRGWEDYQAGVYSGTPVEIGVGVHIYPKKDDPLAEIVRHYERARRYGEVHVTEIGLMHGVYGIKQPLLSAKALTTLADLGAKDVIFYRLLSSPNPNAWEKAARLGVLDHESLKNALDEASNEL